MDKKFYTVKELAEILPIGTSNLYSLVHAKGFPSIKISEVNNDIIAMDTDCNRIWNDKVNSEYSLNNFQIIGDDILAAYYKTEDNTSYHFRRLKIDSGEVIYELNI